MPNVELRRERGDIKVENNGTTIFWRLSGTGVPGSFVQVASEAIATFMGAVDRVGLVVETANAAGNGILVCDWFRRVA